MLVPANPLSASIMIVWEVDIRVIAYDHLRWHVYCLFWFLNDCCVVAEYVLNESVFHISGHRCFCEQVC